MNSLNEHPIAPNSESLRHHFAVRKDTQPGPIDHPDSLAFKYLYDRSGRDAAVLIPIVQTAQGLKVLLTRRADHLQKHPGQISFPGGSIEAVDNSLVETALRETEEEIGVSPENIEVLGAIGSVYTITGYHVTPILGLLREPLTLTPDPSEVAEVLTVPLSFLMNPAVFEQHEHEHENQIRTYYSTYYKTCNKTHRIWGITAGIIVGLYEELRETHR